jgi:chaperonin GroES
MDNIKPLYDRILVKIGVPDEKTEGGIILPDSSQEKPQQGEVVAVGNGKLLDNGTTKPLDVKKGDVVLFNKYGGMELALGDGDYIFLKQDEVLGIIE